MSRQKATNSAGFGHTQVVCPRFLLFLWDCFKTSSKWRQQKGDFEFPNEVPKELQTKMPLSPFIRFIRRYRGLHHHPKLISPSSVAQRFMPNNEQHAVVVFLTSWGGSIFYSAQNTTELHDLSSCQNALAQNCSSLLQVLVMLFGVLSANCSEGVMAVNWIQTDRWLVCCPETSIAAPTTFSACSCRKEALYELSSSFPSQQRMISAPSHLSRAFNCWLGHPSSPIAPVCLPLGHPASVMGMATPPAGWWLMLVIDIGK